MKLNNKYYLLRHGEAVSNVEEVVSCRPEKFNNPLTQKGRKQIEGVAERLKRKNIDLIFTSPLLRTEETAGIIGRALGIKPKTENRLEELKFGTLNGKSVDEFMGYFDTKRGRLKKKPPAGENYTDVLKRVWGFFEEIERRFKGKNILIVSHQAPLLLLLGKIIGESVLNSMDGIVNLSGERRVTKGQLIEVN